jgi:DNA-binding SARP family transcriptional activator
MAIKDLVIRSQLIPPRQRRGVLQRPRLGRYLTEVLGYPLTLVQAGTGYGKSTTLATLTEFVDTVCWYTINDPDRDPLLFLAHLICAFGEREPSWCDPALTVLEETGSRVTPEALTPLLNTLTAELDADTVLVLDDYHLVQDVPDISALVERLVDYAPARLHVVISTRQVPPLAGLARWRVKGELLTIGRSELAFTVEEIETLFRDQYGHPLSLQQAEVLAAETEGWVIALQMVWQSLQREAANNVEEILGQLPSTLESLFEYLAQDVLARLPPELQRFLLCSSVLRLMNGPTCDHVLERQGSAATLRRLHEAGLFIVSLGDQVYRYHHLFHDFLRAQLGQEDGQALALHRRAAEYFRGSGQPEETIHHLLEAADLDAAAALIEEIGPRLVGEGRSDSVGNWLAQLPDGARAPHPGLHLLTGDLLRLRALWDEALDEYTMAEQRFARLADQLGRSRALQGQAQVYLDTVRPLMADSLLEAALRLLEPEEHRQETAAILDKLAENKLNLGHPDEAQDLHHEARLLRDQTDPGDLYLEARAMVRTGHLARAQELLQRRATEESRADQARPPRFHRETLLLLSLAHSLQGNTEQARECALEGIAIGRQLGSSFVEAVGYMRLGHAVQLGQRDWETEESREARIEQASAFYVRAIDQVRAFRVLRTQVEPLWGLCRAHGYSGDIASATAHAEQALEIIRRAGDEWMENLILTTLGASLALVGQSAPARPRLAEAAAGFARVGDAFGRSAALLWMALDAWWQGEIDAAMSHVSNLLPVASKRGYDSLLTVPTFLGLDDEQAAIPLLLEARKHAISTPYVERLLAAVGLDEIEYHPGYSLRVRSLGPFDVWRGTELITAREWKREKARQILQLLLTYRGHWFYREQIVEFLWPQLSPDAGERDFKVALNALNHALEPQRPRGMPPFFVTRRGAVYGLNPAAVIKVDAEEFGRLAAGKDVESLRQALSLYEDDYLPDSLYEDWPSAERQRLRHLYLVAAEQLAEQLYQAQEWDQSIQVCHLLLARDDCWEAAYRLLMRSYAALGNQPQVHQVYRECVATLRRELDVEPSAATRTLFEQLA